MNKYKFSITSGCSFSDSYDPKNYKTWPFQMAKALAIRKFQNEGRGGQGNNMIRMRTIHAVEKALLEYKTQEIIVGIMWSGPDRKGIYYSDETLKNTYNEKHQGKVWIDSYKFTDPSGSGSWKPFLVAHSIKDKYFKPGKIYYKYFHDSIGSLIDTLHDIHYTQLYLESKNIDYFMTNAWNIFEFRWDHWGDYKGNVEDYRNTNIGTHNALNHPDLKWIADSINWDKFIGIEGMWEWCQTFRPDRDPTVDHHPTEDEHREFTRNIIVPYVKKL